MVSSLVKIKKLLFSGFILKWKLPFLFSISLDSLYHKYDFVVVAKIYNY